MNRNLNQYEINQIVKKELNLEEKENEEYETKRKEFVISRNGKGERIN